MLARCAAWLGRAILLSPLEPFAMAVGVIIFEFPAALASVFEGHGDLSDASDRFFGKLPQLFQYAVEIRSPRTLRPDYFRALRNHGIAHVFNSWTDMPSISEQMGNQDAFTTNLREQIVPNGGAWELVEGKVTGNGVEYLRVLTQILSFEPRL
jgi:hypothetical protein